MFFSATQWHSFLGFQWSAMTSRKQTNIQTVAGTIIDDNFQVCIIYVYNRYVELDVGTMIHLVQISTQPNGASTGKYGSEIFNHAVFT